MKKDIQINLDYWVGEYYCSDGWKRLTLFNKRTNSHGGSVDTPIATIDIVNHPGMDGCNAHSEIKIRLRNEVMRQGSEILIDKNTKILRHVTDIVDTPVLASVVERLKENELATTPLSIYFCMEHIEKFETQGDFWTED